MCLCCVIPCRTSAPASVFSALFSVLYVSPAVVKYAVSAQYRYQSIAHISQYVCNSFEWEDVQLYVCFEFSGF